MKGFMLFLMLLSATLHAQVAIPTTPTKFKMRGLGDAGGTSSVGVVPKPPPPTIVRTITYVALSQARQWTSTDGKPLLAKLVAFEDVTVETIKGQPSPEAPKLEGKPTVVKDGKVRLLAGTKPYEVPLTKLSEADREFVQNLENAVKASK